MDELSWSSMFQGIECIAILNVVALIIALIIAFLLFYSSTITTIFFDDLTPEIDFAS